MTKNELAGLAEALEQIGKAIRCALSELRLFFDRVLKAVAYRAGRARWYYLYRYSRSRRVRKKYRKRILSLLGHIAT